MASRAASRVPGSIASLALVRSAGPQTLRHPLPATAAAASLRLSYAAFYTAFSPVSSPRPFSATSHAAAHAIPRPPRPATVRPRSQAAAEISPGNEDPLVGESESRADGGNESPRPPRPRNAPYYQITFTCVPCGHRSHHNVSKQAYHKGSTLITCPGCRNRHVISDHLNIFGDRKITVEDLMREKGNLVKRGSLGEDGDIEFWPDDAAESSASAKSGSDTP
ncbi:DNL zinc finger protein [Drechmeria coniospora]|uniref:DNL zinc finger protein n=1 Tax=Drechmeria coniospora TaxID=98403 RepID=A0A151GNE7_DRECN|nr:DNL zinc finger protein [Drechmeria coniospora]KYK58561.1 DNL zinc finger protein [Drechmeria coniospora]ODA83792.1 hypothetical protein RJ55_02308 [Drechmeria coniospora]